MGNLVWVGAVAAATVYFGSIAEADNDLWMHLFVGRWIWEQQSIPRVDTLSYTAAGLPWVDHEWLWQLLAFLAFHWGGAQALFLGKVTLVIFCVACCAWSLCRLDELTSPRAPHAATKRIEWLWALTLLLTIPVLARGWAMRPQLATYVLLPALLGVLAQWERGRRWPWVALPLGFSVWVNLHGGFVVGLVTLGFFAVAGVVQGSREFLRRCGLLLLCAAASSCNPYGPQLYAYLWDELARPHPITEWQPVAWAAEHTPFVVLGVAYAATLFWLPRAPVFLWRALLAGFVLVLAWRHQRHTPVFALLAAPVIHAQLQGLLAYLRERSWTLSAPAQRVVVAGIGLIALWQTSLAFAAAYRHRGRVAFDPKDYPVAAVRALRGGGARGNLAVPLDWGGYVLWHLAPAIKPSLDGRFATVYPANVVEDNFAFFRGDAGWRRLIENYPTEAVLLPARVVHPLQREPGWSQVYNDETSALFVRSDRVSAFPISPQAAELSNPEWFP